MPGPTPSTPRRSRPVILRDGGALTLLLAGGLGLLLFSWFSHKQAVVGLESGGFASVVHAVPPLKEGEGPPRIVPPEGVPSLSAEACGQCHPEAYAEWQQSQHSKGWRNPLFQAEFARADTLWLCLNCHTPLQAQQPEVVTGVEAGHIERPLTEPNPAWDPALRDEGVTCAGCHVREGMIYGPRPDVRAPHPVAHDPNLASGGMCDTCHQIPEGPFPFYEGAPCADRFDFADGPWARNDFTCNSCHMRTRLRGPEGNQREGSGHFFPGAHSPAMLEEAIAIRVAPTLPLWADKQKVPFNIRLTNRGAGHLLPIGRPDRRITVTWEVIDGSGRVVRSREDTVTRRMLPGPVQVDLRDGRIQPLSFREFTFKARSAPRHVLRVTVRYHLSGASEKARLVRHWDLPADTPDHTVLFAQEYSLSPGPYRPPASPS
ncbi:MAG: cytochrome c family protein [Nitrospirota bacterium]|nr:cytochrome c family protein [Nitrospirota bacterium]